MSATLGGRVPVTPRSDDEDLLHGVRVADPYRWLERADDPSVALWTADQDARSTAFLAEHGDVPWFRDAVAAASSGGRVTLPQAAGGLVVWAQRDPAEPRMRLVCHDHGQVRTLVGTADSRLADGVIIGWGADPTGSRVFLQSTVDGGETCVVHLLDAADGRPIDDPIDGTRHSGLAWSHDGSRIMFARQSAELVEREIRGQETTLWTVLEGRLITGFVRAPDERAAVVQRDSATGRHDVLLGTPRGFEPVLTGLSGRVVARFAADGELLVLRWDEDQAGRIDRLDHRGEWHPVVAGGPAVLEDFVVLGDEVVSQSDLGLTRTRWSDGTPMGTITLPGNGSVDGMTVDHSTEELYFSYTDYATPHEIWRTGRESVPQCFARQPTTARIPAVRIERTAFPAPDGQSIDVTLVMPASPRKPRPVLLTAYGGFGVHNRPRFSPFALAWVAAGGVYAVAAVRGGGERGRKWHQDAVRARRQVSIDDLNAAAAGLVASIELCSDGNLVVQGGSNGGLLAAAAVLQRPDLYRAVLLTAPLTDMVRFERHGLGRRWVPEYGTVADPAEFRALHGYSPYHRALAGVTGVPPVLVAVLDQDTRVDPLHGRKFCAALQDGGIDAYLRGHSKVGHGGKPVATEIRINAEMLAFAAYWTGLAKGEPA